MRRFLLVMCLLGCGDDAMPTDAMPDAMPMDAMDASAGDASSDGGVDAALCDPSPEVVGAVSALDELSGLAHSRAQEVLWAHNDSGDGPRVVALDLAGNRLREHQLDGASARDWEDMALGPHPEGGDALYLGDVGDNAARTGMGTPRSEVRVHRIREPDDGSPPTITTVETFTFTYPDRPRDCESIVVTPTGALYLLTKDDDGQSTLFEAPAPLADGVLTRVADVDFAALPATRPEATAADLSRDGSRLLVRNYADALLFEATPGASMAELIAATPRRLVTAREAQGEAIAFAPDGRTFYTASEGSGQPLHRQSLCE